MINRVLPTEVTRDPDDPRVLTFTGSDSTEDRMGDVIVQSGWELDSFNKNGVFLWGHDASIPAIGAPAADSFVSEDKLHNPIRFPEKGTSELADLVHSLYTQKILSSVSVGFDALKLEPLEKEDGFGTRFLKHELLELSAVNIPANRNAVIEHAIKGVFNLEQRTGLHRIGLLPTEIVEVYGFNTGYTTTDLVFTTEVVETEKEKEEMETKEISLIDVEAFIRKHSMVAKGANLGAFLSDEIDSQVADDRTREEIISAIATALAVSDEDVNEIVDGTVDCPALATLEGIAEALGISVDTVVSAAESDGCEFSSDEDNDEDADDEEDTEEETEEDMGAEAGNARTASAGGEKDSDCGCGKRNTPDAKIPDAGINADTVERALNKYLKEVL